MKKLKYFLMIGMMVGGMTLPFFPAAGLETMNILKQETIFNNSSHVQENILSSATVKEQDSGFQREDTDIAGGTIKNDKGGINWRIDSTGKMIVTGKGDISKGNPYDIPWYDDRLSITSAVINLSETKNLS